MFAKRSQYVVAPRLLSAALLSCALVFGSAVPVSGLAGTAIEATAVWPDKVGPGVLMLAPTGPVTGPEGFWTTPTAVTLVPERPGDIYYRFGAGPGAWTRCDGPVFVPEGKQVLSAVLVSAEGVPGEVVSTTVRSDFSVDPIVGAGASPAAVATYSAPLGGVKVRVRVRAQVGANVRRLGGKDRYDVSDALADTSFGSAGTIIIASGEKFPDALTAAGLAGCLKAPLLLVQHDRVPAQIMTRIKELGAKRVIVCGGPATVYPTVVAGLQRRGLKVERIGGADRYEVAANIAKRIASLTGGGGRVYLARGDLYPDALSLSPLAYAQRAPILLTPSRSLNASTRAQLSRGRYSSARVAGGAGSVSPGVLSTIRRYVPDTKRWGGKDRYEVAVNCAVNAVAQGSNSWSFVGLAKGTVYSDALCGGVAAGNQGGVILLTAPEPLSRVTFDALTAHTGDVRACDVFGGPASITPKTYEQIRAVFR